MVFGVFAQIAERYGSFQLLGKLMVELMLQRVDFFFQFSLNVFRHDEVISNDSRFRV
jgi:hypothetical protein